MPLVVAIVGLLFPNALFLYWLFFELDSVSSLLGNHLGVALFVDAILATGLLAYLFALRPPGRVRWPWLLVLTALGGMGFGLGLLLWLNYKRSPGRHESFASWWRGV